MANLAVSAVCVLIKMHSRWSKPGGPGGVPLSAALVQLNRVTHHTARKTLLLLPLLQREVEATGFLQQKQQERVDALLATSRTHSREAMQRPADLLRGGCALSALQCRQAHDKGSPKAQLPVVS